MNTQLSRTMVGFCFAAMTASVAIAQTTPNPNTPSASHPGMRFEQRAFTRPTERIEARLAYIKTALKITDAQQPQWDAYANFTRKNVQEMEQRFQTMHAGGPEHSRHQRPNAIERLERQQSFHAEAVTHIAKLMEAEKPLYEALSPEQQKVADVVLNPGPRQMPGQMPSRGGSRRG